MSDLEPIVLDTPARAAVVVAPAVSQPPTARPGRTTLPLQSQRILWHTLILPPLRAPLALLHAKLAVEAVVTRRGDFTLSRLGRRRSVLVLDTFAGATGSRAAFPTTLMVLEVAVKGVIEAYSLGTVDLLHVHVSLEFAGWIGEYGCSEGEEGEQFGDLHGGRCPL